MHHRDGGRTQPSWWFQLNRCSTARPVRATPATSSLPAGYALPVIRVLSPWREQNAGSRAPWRTPRGLLSRRSVRLFGCRGATDRPGGGRVRFPMTRTVASDHVCCRRWAVRAHARCPAPRRVPSRHFQVSRSLMSNPGEEVGTNPSHASSTCGSMLRSSR